MNDQSRMRNLAVALYSATMAKEIEWRQTDSKNHFLTSSDSGSITVGIGRRHNEQFYELALLNAEGDEIESLVCEDSSSTYGATRELSNLFNAARSDALDVGSTLDAWFERLGGEPGSSEPPEYNADEEPF